MREQWRWLKRGAWFAYFAAVICLSCVAAYADEDMVARKAMFFKKSSTGSGKGTKDSSSKEHKDKEKEHKEKVSKALLRVSVTLEEGHDTCPRCVLLG